MSNELTLKQVNRILKARMAGSALFHIGNADVRTATALEVAGLFQRTGEEPFDKKLAQIILDLSHPGRVNTPPGPVLFYRDTGSSKQQFALEMKALFFSPATNLREAAFRHFRSLGTSPHEALTKSTRRVIDQLEGECLTNVAPTWQSAALRIHDAIEGDLLCQIAGSRQSIKERYEDGLRHYIPRLLRPTVAAFEGLGAPFAKPSEQQDAIVAEVAAIVRRNDSLRAACNEYIDLLGTLPLAGPGSFVEMVKTWNSQHGQPPEAVEELWNWVNDGGPIGAFYGCVFALSVETTSEQVRTALPQIIVDIFSSSDNERESHAPVPAVRLFWRVFEELGQHYMQHLETIAPGAQGEALATSAWWLARRVAEALLDNPTGLAHLRRVAMQPAARTSQLAWRLANPYIAHTAASLLTHWSLWQISLLAALRSDSLLRSFAVGDEYRHKLHTLIIRTLMFWSPGGIRSNEARVYLFQITLEESVAKWAQFFPKGDQQEFLLELARLYSELQQEQVFRDKFERVDKADEAEQLIIANTARLLSLRNELPLDYVWEHLTNTDWRKAAFSKLNTSALETLFSAFAFSLHRGGDKWAGGLPHIFAQACHENRDDKARAELFFVYAIISCIHTYSASALERLLRGDMRPELLTTAREWRDQLREHSSGMSPWVAGRLRAVVAAISAAL